MGPAERRLRGALRAVRPEQVRRRSMAWTGDARLLDGAAGRARQVAETLIDDRLLGARTRTAAETALHGLAGVLDERQETLARTASLLVEAAEQIEYTQRRYAALGDPPEAGASAAVLDAATGDAAAVRETRADALYRDLEAGLRRVEERLRALREDAARPVDPLDGTGQVASLDPEEGGQGLHAGHDAHASEPAGPGRPSPVEVDPASAGPLSTTPQPPWQEETPSTAASPGLVGAGPGPTPSPDGLGNDGPVGAAAPPDPVAVKAAMPTGAVPQAPVLQDWWRVEHVGAPESPGAASAVDAPIAAAGAVGAVRSLAGVGAIPFRASSPSGGARPARRHRRGRRRLLRDRRGDRQTGPTGELPNDNDGVLR